MTAPQRAVPRGDPGGSGPLASDRAPHTKLADAVFEENASPPGLAGAAVRGVGIAAGSYAVTQAVSLLTYLVLARLLTPADFGAFAAASVLVTVGWMVGESGLLAALIQRRDRIEEAFNTAFLASLAAGLALTVGGLACAPVIGLLFHSYTIGLMSAAMAGSMFLRLALIVPNARLQRSFSFFRRAMIDPLATLVFAGSAVAGALTHMGAWALVIASYANLVVDATAAWALVRWRPRPKLASIAMWRELTRFGRPIFAANLLEHGAAEIPVIAVGRFLGAGPLGQLSYAIRVGSQPIAAVVDVGAYGLLPALARIAHDRERFRHGLLKAFRWTCAIAFPLGFLLIPLGAPAIVLVFGAKWHLAGQAVMALGVYCAALAPDTVATEVFKAAGRPEMMRRMRGVFLVLMLASVGAMVPFGVTAVTVGMAASAIGEAAYAIRGISRVAKVPLSQLLAEAWPPAGAALVMMGLLLLAEHGVAHADQRSLPVGILILALEALFGIGVYLLGLMAMSPSCRRDFPVILRRLRRSSVVPVG